MFLAIEHQYQFALQLKGDLQPKKQKIKEDNQKKYEREVKKINFITALTKCRNCAGEEKKILATHSLHYMQTF